METKEELLALWVAAIGSPSYTVEYIDLYFFGGTPGSEQPALILLLGIDLDRESPTYRKWITTKYKLVSKA